MTKRLFVAFVAVSLSACNGSKSVTAVRVVTEDPGAKCAAGGVSIQSGVDENNNGTLDDGEVAADQTRVICNGSNGTNGNDGENGTSADAGSNGLTALTRVTAEPIGTNCEAGGSKIEVGLDANDDDTLSTEEVQSTSYVCNGTSGAAQKIIYGNVVIETPSELGELAGVEVITGDLEIIEVAGGVLTLPSLKVVGGRISIYGSGGGGERGGGLAPVPLTAANFPNLERANTIDVYSSESLVTLTAIKLSRVDTISIVANDALGTGLSFPLLTDARHILIAGNGYLSTISFAALAHVGDFTVSSNVTLSSLNVPLLATARTLSVHDNAVLASCEAYHLVTGITGSLPDTNFNSNDDTVTCAATDICRSVTVMPFSTPLKQCFAQQTWTAALATCNALGTGSSLLWFTSEAEFTAVQSAILSGTLTASWVGYSDSALEGTFVAANGNAFDPTTLTGFFAIGEPNGGVNENYLQLTNEGSANDSDATQTATFICRSP